MIDITGSPEPRPGTFTVTRTYTGQRCTERTRYDIPDQRCCLPSDHDGGHEYGHLVVEGGDRADLTRQCEASTELVDGPSRCLFIAGHADAHSYEDWQQCIPRGTEGLRECTFRPGHHSPHSFEIDAMNIRPAASGPRRCGTRQDARRCSREYGHTGPCLLQT